MNQIAMTIDNREVAATLPSTWAELPANSWKGIYEAMQTENFFGRDLLHLLMRDKKGRKLSRRYIDLIPANYLNVFFDKLDWIVTSKMDLPHQPKVKVGKKWLYLPLAQFQSMTVLEFAFIDMAWQFTSWFEHTKKLNQSTEWHLRTLAYVCRPMDKQRRRKLASSYDGDIREKFNSALSEERWENMRQMQAHDQFWFRKYLLGAKETLHNRYPRIWPKSTEKDYKEALLKAANHKPQPTRWLDMCRRLAGGKFGTLEQVWDSDLHQILDEVSDQIKQQKERERQQLLTRAKRRTR